MTDRLSRGMFRRDRKQECYLQGSSDLKCIMYGNLVLLLKFRMRTNIQVELAAFVLKHSICLSVSRFARETLPPEFTVEYACPAPLACGEQRLVRRRPQILNVGLGWDDCADDSLVKSCES